MRICRAWPPWIFRRHFVEVGKKRLDELEQFFAFRRQRERPALEQRYAQKFLQLGNLAN